MTEPTIAIDARLAGGTSTGDSAYWSGLLFGLSRSQWNARFLLFSNVAKPPSIPESEKFKWIELHARGSRWWSWVQFPLAARKAGAGAIHTQYSLSPLVGQRGLTTVHDVSFLIEPEWFRPRDRLLLQRFVPASCRRAARVLTVSETSKSEIERLIPFARGKTQVTPLACPIHIDSEARVEVSLPRPYLLTVGTRWPRKNMRLAVEAAAGTSFPLVVTGKPGWGEETIPDRVTATGYVDAETLSALYRNAALYLAPSFHEGFGLTLLEAFACGCPVLCSSGGALPEIAGDAAIVMGSWESSAWARTIEEVMRDSSKLDDLRKRGRERLGAFSWDKTARLTMEAYEQVARAR